MRRILFRCITLCTSLCSFNPAFAGNFGTAIEDSATTQVLGQDVDLMGRLETKFSNISGTAGSAQSIQDFLIFIATEILIPVFVFVGIIFALIAFYKLMIATSDEEIGKAARFLFWGVLGIMIMVSAGYLVDQLVSVSDPGGTSGQTVISALIGDKDGGLVASRVYEKLLFPFLRMAMYLLLGVLFIFALINALKLMFNADEQNEKQIIAGISFSVIGVIVIIIAKSIVEIIFGKYSDVISTERDTIGSIGEGGFNAPVGKFEVIGTVINWILGIVTFVIVIIIIYQGFLLLTKPTDEETMKKMSKNLGYIFIGILIIGAAYLIANFLIFQTS